MDKPSSKMNETPSDWTELSFYRDITSDTPESWEYTCPSIKGRVHYNVKENGWHFRKIGNNLWHTMEKNEADSLRFIVTKPRDRPCFLNVAFYATHLKDSNVRQYMPQEGSMGCYVNNMIPTRKAATDEA